MGGGGGCIFAERPWLENGTQWKNFVKKHTQKDRRNQQADERNRYIDVLYQYK